MKGLTRLSIEGTGEQSDDCRLSSEAGASMVEYSITAVLIVLSFVIVATLIQTSGTERGNKSSGIAKESSIPCLKWKAIPTGSDAMTSTCIESPGCLSDRSNPAKCYCCMP